MFDIGGMEMLLIFIIILVVAGPERLPGIVKTVGRWVGYARRTVNQFKRDFEEEFEVAELRKELRESAQVKELSSLKDEINTIGKDLDKEFDDAERSFQKLQRDAKSDTKTGSVAPAGTTSVETTEKTPKNPESGERQYSGEELVRMAAQSRGIDPDADPETLANSDLPEFVAERERQAVQQIADQASTRTETDALTEEVSPRDSSPDDEAGEKGTVA